MTQEVLDALQSKVPTDSDAAAQDTAGVPGEAAGPETGGASPDPAEAAAEPTRKTQIATLKTDAGLRAHYDALRQQARAIPGFDLDAALRDADFVRLTAPGVGVPVETAWYALHRREIEQQTARENKALLARAVSAGALRPREGGGQTGAAMASDYRALPRSEQLRLKQRILEASARGEKVYP